MQLLIGRCHGDTAQAGGYAQSSFTVAMVANWSGGRALWRVAGDGTHFLTLRVVWHVFITFTHLK